MGQRWEHDLPTRVFDALAAILPKERGHLVRRVEVREGWGDVENVTVFSSIPCHDAGADLEESIHTIVGRVLVDRRHSIKIVWAQPA